jgi:hypothetical protein
LKIECVLQKIFVVVVDSKSTQLVLKRRRIANPAGQGGEKEGNTKVFFRRILRVIRDK